MKKSAWTKGIELYAQELQEFLEENNLPATKEAILNGASSWRQYSEGGCALVCDADIAARLCSPSELKRKRWGELPPNGQESWIDVQSRALFQAARIVLREAAQSKAPN